MANSPKRRIERLPQYEDPAYRQLLRRLSSNLRAIRKQRGWSQEEAGARCGMLMQTFQKIESGMKNVTFTTLARLCSGLKVDAADLLARPAVSKRSSRAK